MATQGVDDITTVCLMSGLHEEEIKTE